MNKKNINKIESKVLPLPFENIDTDQILPAKYLKGIGKEGYGNFLFYHWRFNADGSPKENIFDKPENNNKKILLTGKNFGCGSSREHAVWALKDFGFKAIIASSFGDIFKNNALNNHILPLEVSDSFIEKLFDIVEKDPEVSFEINIEKQELFVPSENISHHFPLNAYKKECFIYGYDDIEYILSHKNDIIQFEKTRKNDFSLPNFL